MSLTFNMVSGNYGDMPTPTEKTVSGAVVYITDALRKPAVALSTAINPVQDLHGYDNPWPAGGGKNMCPDKKYKVPTNDSVYPGQDNDTDFPFSFTAGVAYTLSLTAPSGWAFTVYIREANASSGTMVAANKQPPFTFTPTVTGTYRIVITRTGLKASDISDFQLEQGSTATSFAPYENICPISGFSAANIVVSPTTTAGDGTTYSVSFGAAGTVYGGTLDVTTGTLTIDHQMFLFDGSDTSNWTVNANNYFQRRRPTGFSETTSESWPKKFYSNALETTTRSGSAGNIQFNSFYAGSTYLAVRIDSFNHDLTTFQNFLTNTGLQILVPIEEETVQLTPTEVQMLLGTNNVWSDTNGDVTLTYLADGRVNSLTALNMLLGGAYTPSADVTDREALQIIMGESE